MKRILFSTIIVFIVAITTTIIIFPSHKESKREKFAAFILDAAKQLDQMQSAAEG